MLQTTVLFSSLFGISYNVMQGKVRVKNTATETTAPSNRNAVKTPITIILVFGEDFFDFSSKAFVPPLNSTFGSGAFSSDIAQLRAS